MLERRQTALLALAGCFLAIYGMVVWLVASGTIHRSHLLGAGATLDLTVTAAFATWWLGSRRGHLPRRAPAVVVVLGFLTARLLLPEDARDTATFLRYAWGGVELWVSFLIVAQIGKIRRRHRALKTSGAPDALEQALTPVVGSLIARVFATEIDALGHAFTGWGRRTPTEDARTFSMHRKSHHALIVGVLLFLVAGETAGLHWLVARASVVAAWILTALSIWGALWLVGDMHAVRLRPLRLGDDGLHLGVGIRWRAFIPYDALRSIAFSASPTRGPRTLTATVLGAADVHVTLSRELEAHGLFGRRKRFDEVLLSVDRPEELLAALSARAPR